MQILQIMSNGEVLEITESDRPIKDLLDSNECFILNDDDERIVYLWKGSEAKVRSKFIGARKMQDVRSQVGLNYRSVALDEDEITAEEYPEFLEAIESPRRDGFAKEIRDEGEELKFEIGGGPSKAKPRTYSQMMNSKYNDNLQQTGPLYTGDSGSGTSTTTTSNAYQSHHVSQVELEKIVEELNEGEIPEGYSREMIVVGDKTYTVTEKVQTFLGTKQIKRELEPIDNIPEGIFFAEGYTPRLLVHDQVVIAVELLKKEQ